MALGPQKLTANTAALIQFAEGHIDSAIAAAKFYPVCVLTDMIHVDYMTFTTIIQPKYIKAGWRVVEWRFDENNKRYYIFLSM